MTNETKDAYSVRRPAARLIRGPRDAELAARDWMQYLGYHDARASIIGPDGGVDVTSSKAVAQVKSGDTPTGRPIVQQIFGVAALEEKQPLLFSVSPLTEEAQNWAKRASVALFRLDLSGHASPANEKASALLAKASGRLAGWQAVRAELETLAAEGRTGHIYAKFPTPQSYLGYWCIRIGVCGVVRMSQDFVGSGERSASSVAEAVTILESKFREMGLQFTDCDTFLFVDGRSRPFHPRLFYPECDGDGLTTVGRQVPTHDELAASSESETTKSFPVSDWQSLRSNATHEDSIPTRLTATDVYQLLSNPHCERRLHLRSKGVCGSDPSILDQMLMGLGAEAERNHLNSFPKVLDLSEGPLEERAERTVRAIRNGRTIVYQGVLRLASEIEDHPCEIVGVPDFLIPVKDGHIIRDVKLAMRVNEEERPDIAAQMRAYDWIYTKIVGRRPVATEVVAGDGRVVNVFSKITESELESMLIKLLRLKTEASEPYCPVQYSTSRSCVYFSRCWQAAVDRQDPTIVPGVNAHLAKWLLGQGIETVSMLRDRFTTMELADVKLPHGSATRRLGNARASRILRSAESLITGRVIQHDKLRLPESEHVAIVDLEASPSLGGRDGLVYLWGTCIKGPEPLSFHAAFVTGELTDESTGWSAFLRRAELILDRYGPNTPFLHWASFEKTHINRCIETYGDPAGVGAKVRDRLFDLYRVVLNALTLPVYSYSLKEIEKYVGFERSQDEFGGDWSIAVWDEVVAAATSKDRETLLDSLALYNEEDLEALWAVYQWLTELPESSANRRP